MARVRYSALECDNSNNLCNSYIEARTLANYYDMITTVITDIIISGDTVRFSSLGGQAVMWWAKSALPGWNRVT